MRYIMLILICLFYLPTHPTAGLSSEQLKSIGNKIWKNEAGCSKDKLTWWLDGEEWASLGIGHFIWYPKGITINNTQTFPALLTFLQQHNVALPAWLAKTKSHCPWKTKDAFFADFNQPKMRELRELLTSTIDLQTAFIIDRFSHTLNRIIAATTKTQQIHITTQYHRVANSPNGLYALIDYVNFKGEGINKKERYNNQGWGLLQILENMNGTTNKGAIQEFADTAKKLLAQRVKNAPKKNEERFLLGWQNRINTYPEPL